MDNQNISAPQLTLEEVSAHFKHWRQIRRNRREPIPKKLWQQAAELSRQYSVSSVSKELHLGYMDLKERAYGPSVSKPATNKKDPDFIEIKYQQPFLVSETTLEIEDNKGSKIKICFKGKPDFDLLSLAKAFLESNQ
jgi:hypothetical protein